MTSNQTKLRLEHIPPSKWWKRSKWLLTDDFTLGGVTVPCGFITDGVSTPLLLTFLVSTTGKAMEAAVIHDYLLSCLPKGKSRASADRSFLKALLSTHVGYNRAMTLFYLVRLYGRFILWLYLRSRTSP